MKDLIVSIFKTSEDRIKNPIFGTFILSWIVFNWNPILYLLFADEVIEVKIKYIQQESNYLVTFVYPFLVSLFYVSILPYISLGVDYVIKKAQKYKLSKELNDKIQSIKDENILAIESIKLEKNKIDLLDANNTNQTIEDLNNTIARVKTELAENKKILNDEIASKSEYISKVKNENEKERSILKEEADKYQKMYNSSLDKIKTTKKALDLKDYEINDLKEELVRTKSDLYIEKEKVDMLKNQLRSIEEKSDMLNRNLKNNEYIRKL